MPVSDGEEIFDDNDNMGSSRSANPQTLTLTNIQIMPKNKPNFSKLLG